MNEHWIVKLDARIVCQRNNEVYLQNLHDGVSCKLAQPSIFFILSVRSGHRIQLGKAGDLSSAPTREDVFVLFSSS